MVPAPLSVLATPHFAASGIQAVGTRRAIARQRLGEPSASYSHHISSKTISKVAVRDEQNLLKS